MNWKDVPIPERMRRLERDRRGLPIPFLVVRDPTHGTPHFTINDSRKHFQCLSEDRCAVCGDHLHRGRWFVGGPLSAFHPNGAYVDTPTHDECCHYALQVCPYLAAPKYSGRLDDATFDYQANPDVVMFLDPTMIPERPPVFCAVMAVGQAVWRNGPSICVKPHMPYRKVEFWRHGRQIENDEGRQITMQMLERAGKIERKPPRIIPRPLSPF